MATRRCKAQTKYGKRCKARAIKGSDYCFAHEPALAEQRAKWRREGGHASSKKAVLEETAALESPEEIKKLLARAIQAVQRGDMDPRTANALARLCSLQLKAIRQTEIVRRLDELEQITKGS